MDPIFHPCRRTCCFCFCAHAILNDVVKALEGSVPFFSFNVADGLYVATGFVIVPLPDEMDDVTLLEATGHPSPTKEGAEEAAASTMIWAAKRDFGVVVADFNFTEGQRLQKENENLRKNNVFLSSGWIQPLGHLEILEKTLEAITLDAVDVCPRYSVGSLAEAATVAVQELSSEPMDES